MVEYNHVHPESWPTKSTAYTIDEVIGSGTFGLVWKATCIAPPPGENKICAIKILDLQQFPSSSIGLIRQEIAIMQMSKHKNIVKELTSFVNDHFLWIVMPLIDAGSVYSIFKQVEVSGKPNTTNEAIIATILKQTIEGLNYLHTRNDQMHRDIKAANILLDSNGQVFLSDYGVSATLQGEKANMIDIAGTPSWMAPEVCSQIGHDEKADIWSIGITAIELAKGRVPWEDFQPMEIITNIINQQPPRLEGAWSQDLKDLVAECLQKDPNQRPTCQDLLDNQTQNFLKFAKDSNFLKSQLIKNAPQLQVSDVLIKQGVDFKKQNQRKISKQPNWDFSACQQTDESIAQTQKQSNVTLSSIKINVIFPEQEKQKQQADKVTAQIEKAQASKSDNTPLKLKDLMGTMSNKSNYDCSTELRSPAPSQSSLKSVKSTSSLHMAHLDSIDHMKSKFVQDEGVDMNEEDENML